MEDVRKNIRFIDCDYKTLFTIKDGENIKFTSGYDGENRIEKCRWIDEMHTQIGSEIYHICQWAEICEKNGHTFAPAEKRVNKLDILAANYGEDLKPATIPMTEAAIRKLVGGKYEAETLCYPNRTEQIGNKKVEVKGKAFGVVLRGKDGIAVCGLSDGVLTSLHPYNAQTQKRELSPATPLEKVDFLGKIDKFKAKAAEQPTKTASPENARDSEAR
jgi:hypothetical protein